MPTPSTAETNPLLAPWTTPFGVAPFPSIERAHFAPAFETALAEHRAEVEAIANNPAAPTFANTIEALEKAGKTLDRVGGVFWNLAGTDSDELLRALERDLAPKLTAHGNAITGNRALFARVEALHAKRDTLGLNAEQLRVLEKAHQGFVRKGATLETKAKARMDTILERLAVLGTQFRQNLLADESSWFMALETADDRAGLPEFLVEAAASAATERGMTDSHVITTSRSLIEPFLTFSPRRDLREKAFKAWIARGENGGDTDNRANVAETLALRQERATLLGFATFAAYKLDDSMAKTPAAVNELLETVWPPAVARARNERDELAALAAEAGENEPVEAWDWRYWAEKLRAKRYVLDEASVKAYLPLDAVVDASFHVATKLFGVTFHKRPDVPVYHPDVHAWEVRNADGSHVGVFLADYFNRASKRSGAWKSSFRTQEKLSGDIRPIIVNVMNFARGSGDTPSLLSFDDARTLFHEFGHALHGMLSDVTYPSIAGTAVSRDFVELPSQLYEHWLETPEILGKFTRHYKTGEPMPAELVAKLKASRTFNQGFATVEFLASALVDMAFHSDPDAAADPMALEAAVLKRIGMPKEIAMRHRTPHFAHVFSGDGYSAGYYSYLWSEVLDADAFAAFAETGDVFDPGVAARLKQHIYAAGGRAKPDDAYKAFRGRLPSVEGLLKKRGLA
jgi:peptidyl-dipeptidase Dcp